jgi:hypothetical protein
MSSWQRNMPRGTLQVERRAGLDEHELYAQARREEGLRWEKRCETEYIGDA